MSFAASSTSSTSCAPRVVWQRVRTRSRSDVSNVTSSGRPCVSPRRARETRMSEMLMRVSALRHLVLDESDLLAHVGAELALAREPADRLLHLVLGAADRVRELARRVPAVSAELTPDAARHLADPVLESAAIEHDPIHVVLLCVARASTDRASISDQQRRGVFRKVSTGHARKRASGTFETSRHANARGRSAPAEP